MSPEVEVVCWRMRICFHCSRSLWYVPLSARIPLASEASTQQTGHHAAPPVIARSASNACGCRSSASTEQPDLLPERAQRANAAPLYPTLARHSPGPRTPRRRRRRGCGARGQRRRGRRGRRQRWRRQQRQCDYHPDQRQSQPPEWRGTGQHQRCYVGDAAAAAPPSAAIPSRSGGGDGAACSVGRQARQSGPFRRLGSVPWNGTRDGTGAAGGGHCHRTWCREWDGHRGTRDEDGPWCSWGGEGPAGCIAEPTPRASRCEGFLLRVTLCHSIAEIGAVPNGLFFLWGRSRSTKALADRALTAIPRPIQGAGS